MSGKNRQACALVLGGGGAKGAYQAGALSVLLKEGFRFDALFGTSVGALNAALMAQGSFEELSELWRTISLTDIVDLPKDFLADGKIVLHKDNLMRLNEFRKTVAKKGGLDTAPLRRRLKALVDEAKIRKSGVDFGLVTYELDGLHPHELYLEDIPEGKLVDYLMASSTFPGFKVTTIDGKHFVDGGFHENLPVALAGRRGYRRVVVIDVSGFGMGGRPELQGLDTLFLKNSLPLGNVLDFSKEALTRNRELGRLDALRLIGKLDGIRYYIRRDPKKEDVLENALFVPALAAQYRDLLDPEHDKKRTVRHDRSALRSLLPDDLMDYRCLPIAFLESASSLLDIERDREWTLNALLKEIGKRLKALRPAVPATEGRAKLGVWKRATEVLKKTATETIGRGLKDELLSLFLFTKPEDIPSTVRKMARLIPDLVPARIVRIVLEGL